MRAAEVKAGDAVSRRDCLPLKTEADHQVGADGVGGGGPFGIGRAVVDRPGQEGLHADGRHPALQSAGQVPEDLGFADRALRPVDDQAVVGATAARVDDDPLARQPGTGQPNMFFLTDGMQRTACHPRAEKIQGAQRFRAADAVRGESVLPLVGHQPVVGLKTEVAVDQRVVEAKILQPRLQGGDVVAVHRCAELVGQGAGPQPIGSLAQRPIGGRSDNPVDEQAAALLEGADRVVEFVVEEVRCHLLTGGQVVIGVGQQSQRGQRRPDFHHRATSVTAAQQAPRRGGAPGGGVAGAGAGTGHDRHSRRRNGLCGNRSGEPW